MSKPLIWLPKIQEDIHEIIESVINDTISKDPLLFLTYPKLELLEYNADLQRCVLNVENTKILFYYCYSNFDKCFTIEMITDLENYYKVFDYDRVKVSLCDKILHDDAEDTDPLEKDIPQCKGLEILYKLKLIGVKQ